MTQVQINKKSGCSKLVVNGHLMCVKYTFMQANTFKLQHDPPLEKDSSSHECKITLPVNDIATKEQCRIGVAILNHSDWSILLCFIMLWHAIGINVRKALH